MTRRYRPLDSTRILARGGAARGASRAGSCIKPSTPDGSLPLNFEAGAPHIMMSFLKKLFGSGPESADGCLRRGVGLFKDKKYDRAIAAFTEVIRLDPANGHAYRWRAQAYALSGDKAKADSDYDRAGELTAPVPAEKPVGPAFAKAMSFRMGDGRNRWPIITRRPLAGSWVAEGRAIRADRCRCPLARGIDKLGAK